MIIHLKNIKNWLADAFTGLSRITRSHIPGDNAPIRVDVSIRELINTNKSKVCLKSGRTIGSKINF